MQLITSICHSYCITTLNRFAVVAMILLGPILFIGPAHSKTDMDLLRSLIAEGGRLAEQGDFDEALRVDLVVWDQIDAILKEGNRLAARKDWKGAKRAYVEVEELTGLFGDTHRANQYRSDSFFAEFAVLSYNAGDWALARRMAEIYIQRTGRSGKSRDRIDQVLAGVERAEREEYRKQARQLAENLETLRMYPDGEYADSIMSTIGQHHFWGRGTPRDCGRAATWFLEAARKGSDFAAGMLGDMYRIGLGVLPDYRKAIDWYERAIELNNRNYPALNDLGVMHHLGLGTPRNPAKARSLFSAARVMGVPRSNLALPENATPRWYSETMEAHTC